MSHTKPKYLMNVQIQDGVATVVATHGETISCGENILDLFGECYGREINGMILFEESITPRFFDLRTGIAGEILQKFSNYGIRLAIVGSFNKYESKPLADFIRECNRGRQVLFTGTIEKARAWCMYGNG